jgi:hypothetical protein
MKIQIFFFLAVLGIMLTMHVADGLEDLDEDTAEERQLRVRNKQNKKKKKKVSNGVAGSPADKVCMCITAPCNCNPDGSDLLDETTLTECPVIGPAITCAIEISPAVCGTSIKCFYDNECTAGGAGWNVAKQCAPVQCPVPDPDINCMDRYDPVRCGKEGCMYGNMCLSDAAGWTTGTCFYTNPNPDEIMCKCPETNPDCCDEIKKPPSDQSLCTCLPENPKCDCAEVCPPTNPAVRCMLSPDAYLCGKYQCYYDSECLASSATFEVETDCTPVPRRDFELWYLP